jgi:CDP-diacylglycerol--serine O-phosphatidyltransferase
MVSFGVAPAYLMLKLLEHEIAPGTYGGSELATLFSRFVWLAGAAYISCAAIRLARFNVENEQEESSHMSFLGLPSPAAAGTVISLVIFYQQMLPEFAAKNSILYYLTEKSVLYALPFVVLASAILMVSRIRYPHVVNQYLKGKKPFTHLLWLLLAIGVIIFWRVPVALVFIFCGYTGLGVTRWVNRFLKRVSGRAYQHPGASVYSETKSQTPTK